MNSKLSEEKPIDYRTREQHVFDIVQKQKSIEHKEGQIKILTSDLKKTIKSPEHFLFIFGIERKIISWLSYAAPKADHLAVYRPNTRRNKENDQIRQDLYQSSITSC